MKRTVLATYERESTLWKNANLMYHAQNWCTMRCVVYDYTDDLKAIEELGMRWTDLNGNDVTEQEIEKRYSKPYCISLINLRETNEKCFWFKTKEEANECFKQILKDKVFNGWKRVQ